MTLRMGAIMLLLCVSTGVNAEIGRMFFTPAQRATLDDARKKNRQVELGSDSTQVVDPVPRNVSVNGIVRRSDGKSTVWINNRVVTGPQADGLNISANRNDGRVRLSVPGGGRSVDLKVGQTVEIISGTIADNYSQRVPNLPGERTHSGAGTAVAPGDESSSAQTAPTQKPAHAVQKSELRDRDPPPPSVLERSRSVPSK